MLTLLGFPTAQNSKDRIVGGYDLGENTEGKRGGRE